MDGAKVVKKIFITNMCTDDNKGDLSIIENTVKLLKKIYPSSEIIIQNADYSSEDIVRDQINRFSKKIADRYHGSFFPKVYSRKGQGRLMSLMGLMLNACLSLWVLFSTLLVKVLCRNSIILVPPVHREAWRDLVESDLVIVKGGSYIYSYGGIKQILFTYRMLFTSLLAILLRKGIVFFGHSVGPVKGLMMKSLIKVVLRRADKILLREKLSYEYVNEILGLKEKKLGLIPDLAFLAESSRPTPPQDAIVKMLGQEGISGLSQEDILIGLTARDWWFPGNKNPQRLRENYVRLLLEAIDHVRNKYQAKVLFIPHCLEDLEFVEKIVGRLDDRRNVFILRKDYSPEELQDILSGLTMLIGARIHSAVFALTVGVPVIAIAYEIHKGYGILEMAGQKDLVLDISSLREEDLLLRIDTVMRQRKEIGPQIRTRVSALNSELQQKAVDYFP